VLMPRVAGLSVTAATQHLRALGLRTDVQRVVSSQTAGTVLGQTPAAGAQLRRGMSVTLSVAAPAPQVAVPDVTGLSESAAQQQLTGDGFVVSVVDQTVSDPSQDGVVVDVNPGTGTSVSRGATVTITVGRLTQSSSG
jgi:beta-lactam-binding protein with PASTA domain